MVTTSQTVKSTQSSISIISNINSKITKIHTYVKDYFANILTLSKEKSLSVWNFSKNHKLSIALVVASISSAIIINPIIIAGVPLLTMINETCNPIYHKSTMKFEALAKEYVKQLTHIHTLHSDGKQLKNINDFIMLKAMNEFFIIQYALINFIGKNAKSENDLNSYKKILLSINPKHRICRFERKFYINEIVTYLSEKNYLSITFRDYLDVLFIHIKNQYMQRQSPLPKGKGQVVRPAKSCMSKWIKPFETKIRKSIAWIARSYREE